uniref:CDAN1-interacting nuclease 1 n=1 Tax=Phallusia mammillata TaxID=59560 RepID=A0A6F9D773_9ASCI|nr:uncharacterized protein C15orf41 homolog [Phallusia mammillata]
MKQIDYISIDSFISTHPSPLFQTVVEDVQSKFGHLTSKDALLSICLANHQNHVKKTYASRSSDEMVEKYFKIYTEIVEKDPNAPLQNSVMLNLSNQFDVPPALMARLLLKKKFTVDFDNDSNIHVKEEVSRLIKNPQLIEDKRLCFEVSQCIIFDAGYGPLTDTIRHLVGIEFEDILVQNVKQLDIPYQDETELRRLGFDKTPDVKLEVPIAVNGQPVCWIESKASFGTPDSHKQYLHDQYYSYLNRFGPGLVIYWFGFVEELSYELIPKGIIMMDQFPPESSITKLSSAKVSFGAF